MNEKVNHETHRPNSPLTSQQALDAVAQATLKVSTSALQRNGIENLRILSESQFLDLLRRMQTRRNVRDSGDPHAFGLSDTSKGDVARAHEAKWLELRAKHEQSLGVIESRMEKLSRAFHGIQGVVEKLEKEPGEGVTELETTSLLPPGEPVKQKSLLRQLLLTGEEPTNH